MTADLQSLAHRLRAIEGTVPLLEAIRSVAEIAYRRTTHGVAPMEAYAGQVGSLFHQVAGSMGDEERHALLGSISGAGPTALLLITAERGLCGSFSSRLVARAVEFVRQLAAEGTETRLLCCGSRGKRLLESRKESILYSAPLASLTTPTYEAVESITLDVLALAGQYDFKRILVMHNAPVRRFQYEIKTWQLLPPEFKPLPKGQRPVEIKPADDAPALATHLLTELTLTALYRAVVESALSEQLARIATMRIATDNARKLADGLRAEYNMARQREVTNALLEVVNGYRAVMERPTLS